MHLWMLVLFLFEATFYTISVGELQYPAAAPLTFITITAEEYCREVE